MKNFTFTFVVISIIIGFFPTTSLAAMRISDDLFLFYNHRLDLQQAFDAENYRAIPGTKAGFLIDLEDWARQYGWREEPELANYRPESTLIPERMAGSPDFVHEDVTAHKYLVMDKKSGQILAAHRAGQEWPIASLTKLITADVVREAGVPLDKLHPVLDKDNVGGARLYVEDGERFSVLDLFYAALVGSANNAANALSRSTGWSRESFIKAMNSRALHLNLDHTHFVDPTGIELGNISTPRELARIGNYVFGYREIRRYTTTAFHYIKAIDSGERKQMTNTNWMLWKPEYDDLYVTGGKTGYLNESKWNLLVTLRPNVNDKDRELLIVIFGAESRGESFVDARELAEWAWTNHQWK